MGKLNPIDWFKRWRRSRLELEQEVESLRRENERLREKLAGLQHVKEQLEQSLEERRREKETLRDRLNAQRQASESTERNAKILDAKITELREENERLLRGE